MPGARQMLGGGVPDAGGPTAHKYGPIADDGLHGTWDVGRDRGERDPGEWERAEPESERRKGSSRRDRDSLARMTTGSQR
ncbi:hypothetical protein GCM10017557_70900 [Streptomyces aurantiacus]|uniref:Uncharacterized protein n=1 Tax=Streptomyces aurantiacus TaxID=47760 RepID=A0A7G1PCD6_9ACTN|nr:hypothetical protein GCM10017557_70900 [Streptomyces aurantiacus]